MKHQNYNQQSTDFDPAKLTDQAVKRAIKKLAKEECACYYQGDCFENDGRCLVLHPIFRMIRDGAICCDTFLTAVLPLDYRLQQSVEYLMKSGLEDNDKIQIKQRSCKQCSKVFIPHSHNHKFCVRCAERVKRERERERKRQERSKRARSVPPSFEDSIFESGQK